MKTGTLLLLGGLAFLAVKTGAIGKLSSAVPVSGGGDPIETPIDVYDIETPTEPILIRRPFWKAHTGRNPILELGVHNNGYPLPGPGEVGNI